MSPGAYPRRRVETVLTEAALPPSHRIFPTRHATTPLGTAPAASRFCDRTAGFTMLYAAPDFATAFIEVVVRDRFTRAKHREIALPEVTLRSSARLSSAPDRLSLLDLRNDGCTRLGAPTDAVNARNHAAGRALARDIHTNHRDVDGILFASRLTAGDVYAIFDRALPKLSVDAPTPLAQHPDLPAILGRHDIRLIVSP